MSDPETNPKRPRLLIEEWLPAQAIGVECIQERATGQQPPDKRLHVWWARRPLTVSRAAVLASVLPADFDRATFERLLGFYAGSKVIIQHEAIVEAVRASAGQRIENPHGKRAFSNGIRSDDVKAARAAMQVVWGEAPTVIHPMAGGGSIPLEAARLGLNTLANELNPVACSVLEATVNYPFRFGPDLAPRARKWGAIWRQRFNERMAQFYAVDGIVPAYTYIFARTVPCPDTGHPTPLVPDWHLLNPKGGGRIVAEPVVLDKESGKWTIRVREIGTGAGQLRQPPQPTYKGGSAVSLFTGIPIPGDYVKAMAQQGRMGRVLYAVATKATTKLEFRPAEARDLDALTAAERELERVLPRWERDNVTPTEEVTTASNYDRGHRMYGMDRWADFFSPRQLLALGVLVEDLRGLRPEIIACEGEDAGEAVIHLLALAVAKLANYNAVAASWHAHHQVMRSVFDQHNFSFKATFAEMAPCTAGGGLAWATASVLDAWDDLASLPRASGAASVALTHGSATNLLHLDDRTVTAVVVDPPYADNVQYGELADFFYVWLKRTQGHRRPEWFSTYLCDREEEAVLNLARFRPSGGTERGEAWAKADQFYRNAMLGVFQEAHRVLRDDGALTVMFTHKQQSAWAALFESLIAAGFTITATWPVQTESQHSLHMAKKNAAQSTVLLVARKRLPGAGKGYFNAQMIHRIEEVARKTAERLRDEGLNAVDQLVGAFGPAMEVFSRYDEVKTDTGGKVEVIEAIQTAANAVADWRVEQLASRGLEGVDPDSRFVLLCWDVLGAAEFRFNEAMLLGRAVGMDVARLKETGLVSTTGEKVKLLPAKERRREKAVKSEQEQQRLFDVESKGKRTRPSRKIHPDDEFFTSAIDMCHALALRYAEYGGGDAGIGAVRGTARQQGWGADSSCARMMVALVNAAPEALRFGNGKAKTAADEFPEFRAWNAMLKPVFGIEPPKWEKKVVGQTAMQDFNGTLYAGPEDQPEEDAEDEGEE